MKRHSKYKKTETIKVEDQTPTVTEVELNEVDNPTISTSVTEPVKKDDTRPVQVIKRTLVNIYGTRVVVRPETTPSGKGYKAEAGASVPVEPEDYHYLLSLHRDPGPGCCGGLTPEQRLRHYFGIPN